MRDSSVRTGSLNTIPSSNRSASSLRYSTAIAAMYCTLNFASSEARGNCRSNRLPGTAMRMELTSSAARSSLAAMLRAASKD